MSVKAQLLLCITLFSTTALAMDRESSGNGNEPAQKKTKTESTITECPPALPWPLLIDDLPVQNTITPSTSKNEQEDYSTITISNSCKKGKITKINESLFDALEQGKPVSEIRDIVAQGADITVLRGIIGAHLLEKGAPTDTPEHAKYVFNLGDTPLATATRRGHIEACAFLLQNGANVNQTTTDTETPLHIAASDGNDDITSLLIQCDANINARNRENRTPLYEAAGNAGLGLCTLLIESGADVHAADNRGNKPLHYAAQRGNIDACRVLIEHKADVNGTNNRGETPFYTEHKLIDVWEFLIAQGAKINVRNKWDATPLHHIVSRAEEWLVDDSFDDEFCAFLKRFITMGANLNAKTTSGHTPLHWATYDDTLCKILIEAGARVQETSYKGNTPLHSATRWNTHRIPEVCKLLINQGAKVNVRNNKGKTPLHIEIEHSITKYHDARPLITLLEHGAYACIIPSVALNEARQKRILTALCVFRQFGERIRLPRSVFSIILASSSELRNDLLCCLLPHLQKYAAVNSLEKALQTIPLQFHAFLINTLYNHTTSQLKEALVTLKYAEVDTIEERFGKMMYQGIAQLLGAVVKITPEPEHQLFAA